MASETMAQPSCTEENPDVDECQENIPPGVTAAAEMSKLKVQVGDVIGYSSAQPSGENKRLSDPCTSSTPAPASGDGVLKTRSRLSGLQSALTPILKYLNIGHKGSSPESLKRGNGARLSVPSFSLGVPAAHSTRKMPTLGDKDAPMCWLQDEYLPEMTLLNDTCDSTMQMTRNDSALPDSMPTTPVTTKSTKSTFSTLHSSTQSAATDTGINAQKACPQSETLRPLQPNVKLSNTSEIQPPELPKQNWSTSTDFDAKMDDIPASMYAPERWLDDRYFPEITLLDVTHDSEPSPGVQTSSVDIKLEKPPVDNVENGKLSSETSGHTEPASLPEPGKLDMTQSEELSTLTGNVTHTPISSFSEPSEKCVEENVIKTTLEVTRDISMGSVLESSTSPSGSSGENRVKSQSSAEDSLTHPGNVTHDISSSSNMSIQCASASDMQCNSLKNVTSEFYINPVETSSAADANKEELLRTHDAESTGEEPQPNPEAVECVNRTFTTDEPSTHNKTLDLPSSNGNSPKAESEATDQVRADFKEATETSLVMNQSSSAGKASVSSEVNNATFDRHSLQKSRASTHLGEASTTSFCLQNTFDRQPASKQNGTITLSETNSSNAQQKTLEKPSPSKVCNATTTLNSSEVHPPDLPRQDGTTGTPYDTFEANSSVEVASGADQRETGGGSRSGVPVKDSLSDSLGHQSMAVENNNTNTFNLDDTLDLKLDALVTSTPMPNSKMFNPSVECGEGKAMGAQRKLYGGGPSNPVGQMPSNIVSDRKTFLTQPGAKSFWPPATAASHLLRYKPASTLPGKCEPSASGLPMTRLRAQAEALKTTAASDAAQAVGLHMSVTLQSAKC